MRRADSVRNRRAPHGARGLKLCVILRHVHLHQSRPAWGAWIETCLSAPFPCSCTSRPAWGAWIETLTQLLRLLGGLSRPAWGAWIETRRRRFGAPRVRGRAPHGARGLKQGAEHLRGHRHGSRPAWGAWIETHDKQPKAPRRQVAPRMGRVD